MKSSSAMARFVAILLTSLACLTLSSPCLADGLLIKDGEKVAFLGDSITAQGWEKPGGYVKLIVAGLAADGVSITPIPAGVSGNTSREMLARLKRDVLSKKPDWMTLSCGVNDVWHGATGVELEPYKQNITSIVEQATAAGIKVMILTSTPIGEELDNANNEKLAAYNDFLRQLAHEKNLPLADLSAGFQEALKADPPPHGTKLLTVDGVHMNPAGNMLMATKVLQAWGVSDDQFKKATAAWDAIPDGGLIDIGWKTGAASITLGEYRALAADAHAHHTNANGRASSIYIDALREVLKAHENDPSADVEKIQSETRTEFEAKIKALKPAAD